MSGEINTVRLSLPHISQSPKRLFPSIVNCLLMQRVANSRYNVRVPCAGVHCIFNPPEGITNPTPVSIELTL